MLAANKDLNKYIDMKRLKVLNATQESNVKFLFEDCMNGIESRVDPQIIIVVPFTEPVKLTSISIEAPNDDSAPTEIELFANITDVSFSDVDNLVATETLSLTEEDLSPTSANKLKPMKWNNVSSVVIFIRENRGSESTTVTGIKFFGKPTHAVTNINNIKERAMD